MLLNLFERPFTDYTNEDAQRLQRRLHFLKFFRSSQKERNPGSLRGSFPQAVEKSKDFSTACKNVVTFPPPRGGKVLAALAERFTMQGVQGIRSHARRAAAPSRSPAKTWTASSEQRFLDKLRRRLAPARKKTGVLFYNRRPVTSADTRNFGWRQGCLSNFLSPSPRSGGRPWSP